LIDLIEPRHALVMTFRWLDVVLVRRRIACLGLDRRRRISPGLDRSALAARGACARRWW
jgi:hypothetical protein